MMRITIHCSLISFIVLVCLSLPNPLNAFDTDIFVQDGRLHARIDQKPLDEVLDRVNKETGILVFVDPSILTSEVTAHFQGMSMEEGLKKIVGHQSYAMIFYPDQNSRGEYPVKAIRVYPKGKPESHQYVMFTTSLNHDREVGEPVLMGQEEIDNLMKINEQITLSHVAQQIQKQRNGKPAGNTPGEQSLVRQAIKKSKTVKQRKAIKEEILARKEAFERRAVMESQQKRSMQARIEFERKRQEAMKLRYRTGKEVSNN